MEQSKEEKIKMILDELVIEFFKTHTTGGKDYYYSKTIAVNNAMNKIRFHV